MAIEPILTPENRFPLGQRITLPGHFLEPVTLEPIRFIGSGYECHVRLGDGTPDEAILSLEEAAALMGQVAPTIGGPSDSPTPPPGSPGGVAGPAITSPSPGGATAQKTVEITLLTNFSDVPNTWCKTYLRSAY